MSTKRQQKVNRLIQRDLSEIFQKDSLNILQGSLVTVTSVQMTPDLGMAKVYLSFFPDQEKENLIQAIQDHKSAYRGELGSRIRHQFRKIPELIFYLDDTSEVASKVEELFKKIDQPIDPDEEYKKS